jgi:hypothetical protein
LSPSSPTRNNAFARDARFTAGFGAVTANAPFRTAGSPDALEGRAEDFFAHAFFIDAKTAKRSRRPGICPLVDWNESGTKTVFPEPPKALKTRFRSP